MMNKTARNIGLLLLSIVLLFTLIHLYIFRDQVIDVDLIPSEFSYCGKRIDADNKAYKEIVSWLQANKGGWRASTKKHAPKLVYYAKSYRVNVMEGLIVVSYTTDQDSLQFIKND